jgi:hypothetical protein
MALSRVDPLLHLLARSFLRPTIRLASLLFHSGKMSSSPSPDGSCQGQRLMDGLDDVLVVGLNETIQDLPGFLWTNAGYCFNCRQK